MSYKTTKVERYDTCESYMWGVIKRSRNALVPWYLMLSYLYYVRDISIVPDSAYDEVCKRLLSEYDKIEHHHKHLIDKECLTAGTGFYISNYPERVKSAAEQLVAFYSKQEPIWKVAFPEDVT